MSSNSGRSARKRIIGMVVSSIVFLILAIGLNYLALPAWTLRDRGFWSYLTVLVFPLGVLAGFALDRKRPVGFGWLGLGIVILLNILLSIGSSAVWPGNDDVLYEILPMEERSWDDFAADFSGAGVIQRPGATVLLPTIDKDLSIAVAQGKVGPYGAQYQIDTDIFSSINVIREGTQRMVRVSALDYAGFFVALAANGAPGYVEVDQSTGEGRLVETDQPLRYTPKALFRLDLRRHLRRAYRRALFGYWSFEIDEDGNPWWIVPVLEHTVGLFGGEELLGIIVVDPRSGEHTYYDHGSEPVWIDRVVPSDLVLRQANNRLGLKNGWKNRAFGARTEVFQVSDGYNYVSTVDGAWGRTWLVSGVTSPNEADQTLVGLLMVDLKTREARRYDFGGITEMRARQIAENDERVRAQALDATWPVPVIIEGSPAYYMMLKNNVQRQRFVLLDVDTGNRIAMADSWEGTRAQFLDLFGAVAISDDELTELAGTVLRVRAAGDGTQLFLLEGDPATRYRVSAELNNGALFLAPGDPVTIRYRSSEVDEPERRVVFLRNGGIGQ